MPGGQGRERVAYPVALGEGTAEEASDHILAWAVFDVLRVGLRRAKIHVTILAKPVLKV